MNNENEKYDSIKITFGKDNKTYYYHKKYNDTNWTKISEFSYNNYIRYNQVLAVDIQFDEANNIVFMKYKHENFQQKKKRRHEDSTLEIIKNEEPMTKKLGISLIKKTLGKDGKYYYYESLSFLEDIKDVYWYKTDKSFYDFLVNEHKDKALKVETNDLGEIIYMEYENNVNQLKNIKEKGKDGCLTLITLLIIVSLLIYGIK